MPARNHCNRFVKHYSKRAVEKIKEIYVLRSSLVDFMQQAHLALREQKANLIYGTVRLIEKDEESFLAWARQDYACIVFNLSHATQRAGHPKAAKTFRALIDLGIRYGGGYYLTYHRWATARQVDLCYPRFRQFLAQKLLFNTRQNSFKAIGTYTFRLFWLNRPETAKD